MTPELRNAILEAKREIRFAEGRQTPEDFATHRQHEELKTLKRFAEWELKIASAYQIQPVSRWTGVVALAQFDIDGQAFAIRKDSTEFVLLAGLEAGEELARIAAKPWADTNKFLAAIGDFMGVS